MLGGPLPVPRHMIVHLGQALCAEVAVLGADAPIPGKRSEVLEGAARLRPVGRPLPQLLRGTQVVGPQ